MSLRCGLVGLPSSGKTVIFNAITAAGVSSYSGSEMNRAVVTIPDQRINRLAQMYNPGKVIQATLDVIDIPGLKIKGQKEGHGSKLLSNIKDVDALLHVVRCFEDVNIPFEHDNIDPIWDVEAMDLELMAADSTTLENKLRRLEKIVRSGDKDAAREASDCEKVYESIQKGIPARKQGLSPQEKESVKECNLVSLKPVLYIANIKSPDERDNEHVAQLARLAHAENMDMIAICGKDEADISQLDPEEQKEFLQELGLEESSMERLLLAANRMLGVINFFTVGEDEVHAWSCKKGDKAPTAAGKIHTDMEKGFIRMEVMSYTDLIELGSESAVARAGKQRLEGRDYEVQDGDIVVIRFNRKS